MALYNLTLEQNKMGTQEKITPSERTRLWREAHKNDPAYRQRAREERRRYRQKRKNDPVRHQAWLEKERQRQKKARIRRKQERTDLNKICPICGEAINYWCEDSVKDAIERERNNGGGAIALRDGKCFCCTDCYGKWKNIRKCERKKAKEMNKILNRFVERGGKE